MWMCNLLRGMLWLGSSLEGKVFRHEFSGASEREDSKGGPKAHEDKG